jgi:hypothetical protein
MKRTLLGAGIAITLLFSACDNGNGGGNNGGGEEVGSIVDYVLPYSPYDYEVLKSQFTSTPIMVDGQLDDAAWATAASSTIDNFKDPTNPADFTGSGAPTGTIKSAWDGYTLYIAVEVNDTTPAVWDKLESDSVPTSDSLGAEPVILKSNGAYGSKGPGTPGGWGWTSTGPWNGVFDSVEFDVDFWNDKIDKWADDDGIFAISRSGKLVYDVNVGGSMGEGTQASVHASPDAREYTDRVKAYATTEKAGGGYIIELAIEIYGAKLANGTAFGIDIMISDSPSDGTARTSRTYWSHSDNTYRFSSVDGNLDWGAIVLTGHPDDSSQADFAKSSWMLTNAIRWVDKNLPGTTGYTGSAASVENNWAPTTWSALNTAVQAGRAINTETSVQETIKGAAQNIEAAIAGLVQADDPIGATAMTYPVTNSLPDPLVFKTNLTGKNPGDVVANTDDWVKRAEEIRQLASIYEYGPKPGAPSSVQVTKITGISGFPAHWEPAPWYYPFNPPMKVARTGNSYTIESVVTYNGTEDSVPAGKTALAGQANITFNLYTPSLESGETAPVLLNYDSTQTELFTENGVAIMTIPAAVTTDDRVDPWNDVRGGTFRQFFPYDSRGQRYEMSNEMGAAWGAWRAIDALKAGKNTLITEKSIVISTPSTEGNNYTIKDRMSAEQITVIIDWYGIPWPMAMDVWWQVGQLEGADTVEVQSGSGKPTMLYLQPGSPAPDTTKDLVFRKVEHLNDMGVWEDVTAERLGGTYTSDYSGWSGDVPKPITAHQEIGEEVNTNTKLADFIAYDNEDTPTELAVSGYSINGKYAFTAGLFDERIGVVIPGAAGASGPQTWRYNPAATVYSPGNGNSAGGELIGDHVMKNPGRSTEVFRRFLTNFNYYERLRGIDANGDFSHGYAQRLPYDGHELVASMYPRAVIERAVMNDFNDGSEQDAIAFQGARLVYRKLVDLGVAARTPGGVTVTKGGIDDLVVFNYHKWFSTGDPHGGIVNEQRSNESIYMNWYFKSNSSTQPTYLSNDQLFYWNTDPFFEDVLVVGGSNAYERHYGGFPVMMPWAWASSYYPTR